MRLYILQQLRTVTERNCTYTDRWFVCWNESIEIYNKKLKNKIKCIFLGGMETTKLNKLKKKLKKKN